MEAVRKACLDTLKDADCSLSCAPGPIEVHFAAPLEREGIVPCCTLRWKIRLIAS